MRIEMDNPDHLPALVRLNEEWITEHFGIEAADRALAADPGSIRRQGGHTFAAVEDGHVRGAALALYRALGFETVREGPHPVYSRCDRIMRKTIANPNEGTR